MVTPELKHLLSPDLPSGALPPDPTNCSVSLQALIGPRGENVSESFEFTVVTPTFLASDAGARWGRGLLIVPQFDWSAVERMLERVIAASARDTWPQVAAALGQQLGWEFENYSPHAA